MAAAIVRTCVLFQAAAGLVGPKAWRARCDVVSYHDFGLRAEPSPTEPLEPSAALDPVTDRALARTAALAKVPAAPPGADSTILVQGGSLRTWSYRSPLVEQVKVVLSTDGRPLDADIELWHGPDNTPCKMRVYVENGQLRPFNAVIETPRGPNTVAIRNIGQIEFPIAANVVAEHIDQPSGECLSASTTVQGGALRTYPFDPSVDSVEVG